MVSQARPLDRAEGGWHHRPIHAFIERHTASSVQIESVKRQLFQLVRRADRKKWLCGKASQLWTCAAQSGASEKQRRERAAKLSLSTEPAQAIPALARFHCGNCGPEDLVGWPCWRSERNWDPTFSTLKHPERLPRPRLRDQSTRAVTESLRFGARGPI
jgi:hypothetical protein